MRYYKKGNCTRLNQFIKQNTIWWKKKIYQPKLVQFVKDHLLGAKNGSWTGKKSNTAQKGVLIKKFKYEFGKI